MTFTKEQLEERKKGIGASEAAAVLGLNPFMSPLDVWSVKKGLKVIEETPAMRLGTRLEPVIAEMYQERTGLKLCTMPTLAHPGNNILFATPDRLVVGIKKGLEIKTANARMADQWGEEGTDQIPQHYLIQCVLCMSVTDMPAWDVAALVGGQDFRIYTIQRDIELETTIIEKLLDWWETYMVQNKEPEIDSSRSCADYLAAKYPRNFQPIKQADEGTERLLSSLAEIKYHLESYEEQEEAVKNLLKNYIGEADGVQGQAWKCTWKVTKDTKIINWEGIAKMLLSNAAVREIMLSSHGMTERYIKDCFTTIQPGARRFLFTKSK